MKTLKLAAIAFASLSTNLLAATFTSAPKVDTIADLTNRVVSTSSTTTTPYVEVARFASDRNYWPETRMARFVPGSTATVRHGCVEATSTGNGRWIFDDCFDTTPLDIRWTGGESVLLTGLTNRFTASFIPIDSMPAWEAARDLKSELGGGVIKFEYGEYRFGSDTTPGSFILKPNIGVSGQFGGPMGDEAHEGTYANDKVARTMIGTIFHVYNAGTNGAGFPVAVASAKYVPAYTNSPIASFVDANGEWVSYNRGGNFIENIGLFGSWDWSWNGTNYPAAGLVIDEVAGLTLRNVYFGPSPGPAIWARGAFGLRGYDFFMDTPLTPAVVIVDTSDTKWSRGSIAAARGASFSFTGELRTNGTYQATANTHIIDDVDVWNNAEELVGWVGTSQATTNYTVVESSGVRRTGWSVDPVTDLFGVTNRMGSDTGLPVMVRGTDIPGGLNTNAVYYVRWGSAGGTNFYLHNTSGSAIRGTSPVDVTSTGTNWWLEAPAAQIFARDAEEIKIDGMRADQSFSGVADFGRINRVLINGLFAWEIGLNQTETRQSRKQTFYDPNIIGIRLENVNSFNMSGSSLIGSKGNSGLSTPWIHNSYGIVGLSVTDSKISGLFDRLNTGIYFDASSGSVNTEGAAFGSWVSKPIEATDGYGVVSHVPYFNGNTNSQIVATLGSSFTNLTGDFSIAFKAQVPTATTNGWANGRHSALVNLTSVTNTTAYGALVAKSASLSFWRSPVDNSINLVTTLGGTNYDPTIPSTERFAIGADVTPFIGKAIEIVYQRRNGVIEMYVEGQLKQQAAINNSTTGGIYAPYFLMGQVGDSGQFSHPQAPIYGVIMHRNSFSKAEINNGTPWTRHGGTNAVLYWDFDGATLASGVKDWSGNGHDGVVQQIGAVAPEFGTSRNYNIFAGSGVSVTRNGKRSVTISATMDTESVQDIVGGMVTAGSNAYVTYNDAGNSLTISGPTDEDIQDKVAALLVAGSNISITYDDLGNTLTIASTGGGGATNGSTVSVDGSYMGFVNITNSSEIDPSVSGTNLTLVLLPSGVTAGTYPYASVTVNNKGIITGISSNTVSGGGGSNSTTFVNGTSVTNPNLTNTDGNIVLSITSSTNINVNLGTNLGIDTLRVNTIVFSNAVGVASGGTGLSNITSEAYLVGQGTNALRAIGPTTTGLAGWSNSVAIPYAAGSGITLSGGVISATGGTNLSTVLVSNTAVVNPNFVADTNTVVSVANATNILYGVRNSGVTAGVYSNANITVGADGRIISASTGSAGTGGGGTNVFSISTNNLGYLERDGNVRTIQETSGDTNVWTITIPANTLGLDGDEVNIHTAGILTIYSSGGDNGYSWRLVSDSSSVNASELSTTNRYFSSFGDPARSVDWNFNIKRVTSNQVFITTTHSVGPGINLLASTNASTNLVTTTMGRLTTFSGGNLAADPIDFSFYVDIADDARAATMLLYGYLVHKVGTLGQTNYISSVSTNFSVTDGQLNWAGGSGGIAYDVDVTYTVTNTGSEVYPVYTNAVPSGVTRWLDLKGLQSGATNRSTFKLNGVLANRSGTVETTNWVEHQSVTEANSAAYVTNSGTNLLVVIRGPVYGPQNGRIWGWLSTMTNAGAYSAGGSSFDTNGLLLVWRFDESGTGNKTSSDPYALVLVSTNSVASVTGVKTNAAKFTRASNMILGMNTTNLVEATTNMNFSLSVWVRLLTFPGSGQTYGIISKDDPGVNTRVEYSLALRYTNATAAEVYFLTGTNATSAGTYLVSSTNWLTSTNVWYHIAAGRSVVGGNGTNWISVNAETPAVLASPIGPAPTAAQFRVGAHGSATHLMNGDIDEFSFWRTNLTPTQIAALATNPPPTLP